MKYRKKPVVIEAIQWNGINLTEIKEFVGNDLDCIILDDAWKVGHGIPHVIMHIHTLEGDMKVSRNDYIIKGVNGEFYPCKPDIFEKTYEISSDTVNYSNIYEKAINTFSTMGFTIASALAAPKIAGKVFKNCENPIRTISQIKNFTIIFAIQDAIHIRHHSKFTDISCDLSLKAF